MGVFFGKRPFLLPFLKDAPSVKTHFLAYFFNFALYKSSKCVTFPRTTLAV